MCGKNSAHSTDVIWHIRMRTEHTGILADGQVRKIDPQSNYRRRVGLAVFAGFFVSALIAASTLIVIWTSHQAATSEWRKRISGLTMMIGGHAKQAIEATDEILLEVVKSLNSMDLSTVEELSAAVQSEEFHRQLAGRIKGAPHIELMAVISRDGFVISNSVRHVPPYRFSQWDRLRGEILDNETDRIFSDVFVATLQKSDEPIIGLARKVFTKSGQVLALVGAGVKTGYFAKFYASLPSVDRYIINIINQRGTYLAGFGEGMSPLGQKIPYKEFDQQLRDGSSLVFLSQNSGDQLRNGQSTRLVAMVRVQEISMVATASISSAVYLAQWRQSAAYFGLGGGAFTLLMIFLTLAVRRLYKEIEEARQTAVANGGAKTRFLSSISHEIRTPLNVIRGSAQVLLDEKSPQRPESTRKRFSTPPDIFPQ